MKKSLIPDTWLMLLQLEELGSFSKARDRAFLCQTAAG